MIVKVQRPVYALPSSSMDNLLLVYSEDHSIDTFCPQTPRVLALMGDDYKMYCRAHLDKDKQLVIDQRIPEQSW